jgi:hypothetical protein
LAVDDHGNAYVAATTTSLDFPTTAGAFQPTYGGTGGTATGGKTNYPGDAFVAKLSADGMQLLASTYIGGRFGEGAEGVAVGADGEVYVSGATYSDNFPVTADAVQSSRRGKADCFAVKLSADFRQLVYATYLGGNGTDYGRTATVDALGNFYVAGDTDSPDWPLLHPLQVYGGGKSDGILAKPILAPAAAQ